MFPIRSLLARMTELIRQGAPPALTFRVWRWMAGYGAREFAFQLAAVYAATIALVLILHFPGGTLGAIAVAALGVLLAVELWFAWESWRSAGVIRRELDDEVPGEPA